VGLQTAVANLGIRLWLPLLALWAALVIWGGSKLEIFAATPGARASLSSSSAGRRFHLYIFLHPLCPCSRASINELIRLKESYLGTLDVTAVIDNAGFTSASGRTLLTELMAEPRFAVQLDADGRQTASFGAKTSGQVLLYDPTGSLAFSGGITASRAHEGVNAGETAISDIVNGRTPTTRSTPCFGCALSRPITQR
jgi:hypothetical protein